MAITELEEPPLDEALPLDVPDELPPDVPDELPPDEADEPLLDPLPLLEGLPELDPLS